MTSSLFSEVIVTPSELNRATTEDCYPQKKKSDFNMTTMHKIFDASRIKSRPLYLALVDHIGIALGICRQDRTRWDCSSHFLPGDKQRLNSDENLHSDVNGASLSFRLQTIKIVVQLIQQSEIKV